MSAVCWGSKQEVALPFGGPHPMLPLKLTHIQCGTSCWESSLILLLSPGHSWFDPEPGTVPSQSSATEGGRCYSSIGQPATEGSPGHAETRLLDTADIPGLESTHTHTHKHVYIDWQRRDLQGTQDSLVGVFWAGPAMGFSPISTPSMAQSLSSPNASPYFFSTYMNIKQLKHMFIWISTVFCLQRKLYLREYTDASELTDVTGPFLLLIVICYNLKFKTLQQGLVWELKLIPHIHWQYHTIYHRHYHKRDIIHYHTLQRNGRNLRLLTIFYYSFLPLLIIVIFWNRERNTIMEAKIMIYVAM